LIVEKFQNAIWLLQLLTIAVLKYRLRELIARDTEILFEDFIFFQLRKYSAVYCIQMRCQNFLLILKELSLE
jgi:hypothetical protein